MIRLLLLLPLLRFASPKTRAHARARLALWLVRLAAHLDVAVVVLTASAISATVDLLTAEAIMNEPADRPWPKSNLN